MKNISLALLIVCFCVSCFNPFDAEQSVRYFLTLSRWRQNGFIDPYLSGYNPNSQPVQDTTRGYRLWKRYFNNGTGITNWQLRDSTTNKLLYDTLYFKWTLQKSSTPDIQTGEWEILEKEYLDSQYQTLIKTRLGERIVKVTSFELVISTPSRHGSIKTFYIAEPLVPNDFSFSNVIFQNPSF